MSQTGKTFKYFIARKGHFLVVSFVGSISNTVLEQIERCKSEIQEQADVRALVLHFAEVTDIAFDAIPVIAQIQHMARTRNMVLRLSGLVPEVLEKLHKKGIIRKPELAPDLKEALVHVARAAQAAPPPMEIKKAA